MFRLRPTTSAIVAAALLASCGDPPAGGNIDAGDVNEDIAPLDAADGSGSDAGDVAVDVGELEPDAPLDTDADVTPDSSGDDPCNSDVDCPPGGVCVDLEPGPDNGFCTVPCSDDSNCPEGADCVLIGTGADRERVCIDLDFCLDRDEDRYGFGPGCDGDDCDDANPAVNAGAIEACNGIDDNCNGRIDDNPAEVGDDCSTGFAGVCAEGRVACEDGVASCVFRIAPSDEVCDGEDNDCDGTVDNSPTDARTWYRDADSDRFGTNDDTMVTCSAPEGYVDVGGDCNDAVRAINPTATEICDGVDNNCDDNVDGEGVIGGITLYADTDGDGFGDPDAVLVACGPTDGYVTNDLDCDDASDAIRPTATEVCDGVDNNCNDQVDEAGAADAELWYVDADEDGFGADGDVVASCVPVEGRVTLPGDCNDDDDAIHPDAEDLCDGVDNNCNTILDDASGPDAGLWYLDTDNDGWGDATDVVYDCYAVEGRANRPGDCNDANDRVNPDATEVCDGIDNNCAGGIDEGVLVTFWRDQDGDTRGNAAVSQQACSQPDGYVANTDDCNDFEPEAWTGRPELCDGIDNNCNGNTDEGVLTTYYRDQDNDTRGNPAIAQQACAAPAGFVANANDCNDAEPEAWAGRGELCDGIDNNCNTQVDEGVTTRFYRDADTDTFGDGTRFVDACTNPGGYVLNATDCDDTSASRYPGASEVCDGVDNNCNTQIDEGVLNTYYRDQDADGRGNPGVTTQACTQPAGHVANADDCNDAQPAAWTGRDEICDGIDNNCNGSTDEGVTIRYYRDADNDTYGNAGDFRDACSQPVGFVTNATDCDDTTSLRSPGRAEICDGVDNNCNSSIDEGVSTEFFVDADGDTYGSTSVFACTRPAGTATRGGDCNDANVAINPGQPELCSTAFDDNCNSQINESTAIDATWWFLDDDGDGQGATTPIRIWPVAVRACTKPADFCPIFCFLERIPYVNNELDCDDSTTRARTGGGPEVCDGYDNDCLNGRDDGFSRPLRYYRDRDDDGWGDSSTRIDVCAYPVDAPAGDWVTQCCDSDDDDAFEW